MFILGNFNAKSKSWYTKNLGSKIDFLTSNFGFHQIINKPTHILNNSSSSVDLIFTTKPNLVVESGVHSSLHANCHQQLPYVKFNLNVFYPPLYKRKVWHYKLANFDCIQRAIKNFDWEKAFLNVDVNKKVFNEILMKLY